MDGTARIPILERIAPGVNVKDVRTWVFYFSIHGTFAGLTTVFLLST